MQQSLQTTPTQQTGRHNGNSLAKKMINNHYSKLMLEEATKPEYGGGLLSPVKNSVIAHHNNEGEDSAGTEDQSCEYSNFQKGISNYCGVEAFIPVFSINTAMFCCDKADCHVDGLIIAFIDESIVPMKYYCVCWYVKIVVEQRVPQCPCFFNRHKLIVLLETVIE